MPRSAQLRFGTRSSPQKSDGFQAKNSSVGTSTTAHVSRPADRDAMTKAGVTVRAGRGHRSVGTPVSNKPTYAGTNRPPPATRVQTPLFTIFPSWLAPAPRCPSPYDTAPSKIFSSTIPPRTVNPARTPNGKVIFPVVTCPERKPYATGTPNSPTIRMTTSCSV